MTKKTAKIRDQSVMELEGRLVDLKSELAKDRSLSVSGTKAEKPSKIRKTRRNIARILTIIKEKSEVNKKE